MKNPIILTLLATIFSATSLSADTKIGTVNFARCIQESKLGKHEKSKLEQTKNQMENSLKETDKQLREMASQLQDSDYMDGLTPQAENELKMKFQQSKEEMQRYQSQYYQLMQQENMKMLQRLQDTIKKVSSELRTEKNLTHILNDEILFSSDASLEVTNDIIKKMDTQFDAQQKK